MGKNKKIRAITGAAQKKKERKKVDSHRNRASLMVQLVENSPVIQETACNAGRSGRSPREGNGNPLQYSCLENPVDIRVWQATVHRATESDTASWLNHRNSILQTHSSSTTPVQPVCVSQKHDRAIWSSLQLCWLEAQGKMGSSIQIAVLKRDSSLTGEPAWPNPTIWQDCWDPRGAEVPGCKASEKEWEAGSKWMQGGDLYPKLTLSA